MRMRLGLAAGLVLCIFGSQAEAQSGKDAFGDPLPQGAKARLGTERMRGLEGQAVLMPDGKTILSESMLGIAIIDTSTGLATGKLTAPKGKFPVAPTVVSADGKRGATNGAGTIAVVELETGKRVFEIQRLSTLSDGIPAISKDGAILALGATADARAKDKGVVVRVWNADDNKELAAIKVAQNTYARVALSADGKVLATWGYHNPLFKPGVEIDPETDPNRQVEFWDAATGQAIATARFGATPTAVALAPDGQTAAISDGTGTVKLFSAKTGELKRQLLGRSHIGRLVQFSGDGKAVAASTDDGAIQIWNVATGRSAGVTECPVSGEFLGIRNMSFPTAERLVAFAARNAGVVWEAPSGKRLTPPGGHTHPISAICFSDGDKKIIGMAPNQVIRWSLAGKELEAVQLRVPGSPITSTALAFPRMERIFAAPNCALAYRQENATICLYDLATGHQKFSLPTENSYAAQLNFSKDGGRVAVVIPPPYTPKPKAGRVLFADVARAEITGGFALPPGIVVASAVTSDFGYVALLRRVTSEGKEPQKLFLHGFDSATGKQTCEFPVAENFGNFYIIPSFVKDRVLLVSPKDGVIEYDMAAGKKLETLMKAGIGFTTAPVLSDDGKFLACAVGSPYASDPSTIEVRNAASGEVLHKFKGHARPVTALAFSKDGTMLATGSTDSTILVWNLAAEKE